jgi:hypothetical protein
MAKCFDPTDYDLAFRPNYEGYAFLGWVIAALTAGIFQAKRAWPLGLFYGMMGLCGVMALRWLPSAIRIARLRRGLRGRPMTPITLRELHQKQVERPDHLWLGAGFVWEPRHTQRVFEILRRDLSHMTKQSNTATLGQPWIHGVESRETQQYFYRIPPGIRSFLAPLARAKPVYSICSSLRLFCEVKQWLFSILKWIMDCARTPSGFAKPWGNLKVLCIFIRLFLSAVFASILYATLGK